MSDLLTATMGSVGRATCGLPDERALARALGDRLGNYRALRVLDRSLDVWGMAGPVGPRNAMAMRSDQQLSREREGVHTHRAIW